MKCAEKRASQKRATEEERSGSGGITKVTLSQGESDTEMKNYCKRRRRKWRQVQNVTGVAINYSTLENLSDQYLVLTYFIIIINLPF